MNTQLVECSDDAIDSVCHHIEVGDEWCGDMNSGVASSRNQTVADFVCETAVPLKDKKLTSGTRICELVWMLTENSLSKFCYDVNNCLKFELAWNFNMVISGRAICVTFKHLRFSR